MKKRGSAGGRLFKAQLSARAQAELKVGKDPEYPLVLTDSDGAVKEGKPLHRVAKPLDNPPRYAMRLWPKAHHTMGGIEIDADTKVYDLKGSRIQHLYAAGEVAGGIHGGCRLGS